MLDLIKMHRTLNASTLVAGPAVAFASLLGYQSLRPIDHGVHSEHPVRCSHTALKIACTSHTGPGSCPSLFAEYEDRQAHAFSLVATLTGCSQPGKRLAI